MLKQLFFISISLALLLPIVSRSQNIGVGADVMYNFQTESIGAGARVNFFPNKRLSIVPQFAYYFAFNKINEYYAGLGLEFKFIRRQKFNLYAVGQGAYNSWLNYQASEMKGAQQNNWNFEGGIGISNNRCLRPFMEYRYNVRFRETHLRLGLLYVFGCRNGGGGGARGGGHGNGRRCAAYD
jgi:hypothetical protein